MSMLRTNNVESLDSSVSIAVKSIALNGEDYISLGAYTSGLVVDKYNETFSYNGMEYRPLSSLTLPYTTDGSGAPEIANFLPVGDAALRQGLIDSTDPENGSAILGRSAVVVGSVADLLAAKQDVSQAIFVKGYIPTTDYGGGVFKWGATRPKSDHNGGTVISPTVPWDGQISTLSGFLSGVGETTPTGIGCWVRQGSDSVNLVDFGAVISTLIDSSPSWQAATVFAAANHLELKLPDGAVKVSQPAIIDGIATGFSTVKLRGTFATTATRLGYIPDQCGSVIYTDGNSALDIRFNRFFNENFSIKGVGFCDASHFPNGTPNAPVAAVLIRKGNADGSDGRYITGNAFEDCAFNGYDAATQYIGMVAESVPSAALLNYIGPTSYIRTDVVNCKDAVLLQDCSMNHLWVSNSTWFSMTGFGVRLIKTLGGSGGNVSVTYSNMVFEGMLGPLNTAGVPGAGQYRNTLVLNSCNREFCGLYGPTGAGGFYQGNPLGFVGNTDVFISGVWTKDLAYGEETLPTADIGSVISSTVPASFAVGAGGKVITPETINVAEGRYTIDNGATVTKSIVAGGTGGFAAKLLLEVGGGALGYQEVLLSGQPGGGKRQTVIGDLPLGVTAVYSAGASADIVQVAVTNSSGFNTDFSIRVTNRSGFSPYIL